MVYVIHPWSMVMLLFLVSVAVMVHSSDDTDIPSVTGHRPETRDLYSARLSEERIKHQKRHFEWGTYQAYVLMDSHHRGGTEGAVSCAMVFQSGRVFASDIYMGTTDVAARNCSRYEGANDYYVGDKVSYLSCRIRRAFVYTDKDECSCAWFPRYIIIQGPQQGDRYRCDRGKVCCNIGGGGTAGCPDWCHFGETDYGAVINCEADYTGPGCM